MALISRIFGSKKKSQAKKPEIRGFNPWKAIAVSDSRITVLVFRECHIRGRRLLFDSSSVQKITTTTATTTPVDSSADTGREPTTTTTPTQPLLEVENGVGFLYKRQRADAKSLAEIVFGSVPLAFAGATNKLHVLSPADKRGASEEDSSDPLAPFSEESMMENSAVLLSRVFVAPKSVSSISGNRTAANKKPRSNACSLVSKSLSPFRLELSPSQCACPVDCPVSNRLGNSGCEHTGSVSLRPPSSCVTPFGTPLSQYDGSVTSHSSCQNRGVNNHHQQQQQQMWRQSSLDWLKHSTPGGVSSGNSANSPLTNQSFSSSTTGGVRAVGIRGNSMKTIRGGGTRLAVAVLLTSPTSDGSSEDHGPSAVELVNLLSHHLQLILCRLQVATETAYVDRKRFVRTVFNAAKLASQDMLQLLSATRLSCPVWLGLATSKSTITTTTNSCSSPSPSTSPLSSPSSSSPTRLVPDPECLTARFVSEFIQLVKQMDTKQMSFFVSTLLTAVLTHHVGWVGSNSTAAQHISYRGARILVLGSSHSLVDRVLFVLSYFVRQRLIDQVDHHETAGKLLEPVFSPPTHPASSSPPRPKSPSTASGNIPLASHAQPLQQPRSNDSHPGQPSHITSEPSTGHDLISVPGQCRHADYPVQLRHARRLPGAVPRSPAVIPGHSRQRHVSECHFQLTDQDMDGEFDSVLLETSSGETGKHSELDSCFDDNNTIRQSTDSIRDSFHYLRGYYSYRYLQASQTRRVRHFSEISAPANSRDCSNRPLPFDDQQRTSLSEDCRAACDFWCTTSKSARDNRYAADAWSVFSTATNHYISGIAVSGIVGDSVEWQSRLLDDARAASLDGDECLWIIANTNDGSVCVLNSCDVSSADPSALSDTATTVQYSIQHGLPTVLVVLSPLVAALVESSFKLHEGGLSSSLVLVHMEQQLSLLTHRAAELAQLLANSAQLSLSALLQTIGIDSNDVPLLLAIATVLFPHMGVLTVR